MVDSGKKQVSSFLFHMEIWTENNELIVVLSNSVGLPLFRTTFAIER